MNEPVRSSSPNYLILTKLITFVQVQGKRKLIHCMVSLAGLMSSIASSSMSSSYYPWNFQFQISADCDQICTNTQGSFLCSCVSGYQLASDGKTCLGKSVLHFGACLTVLSCLACSKTGRASKLHNSSPFRKKRSWSIVASLGSYRVSVIIMIATCCLKS